jgi:uncharacterized membrane protein
VALIDQRILIDAPPQVIWEYVSDPARLTMWHAGYRSISVLSTQQAGLGTRRRCAPADGGKDVIEEITAWVDGLGYEYRVVEGGSYRSFQGRIRLQPSPDGTSVQWTVWYRPGGIFGAIKNRLGGHRKLAAMMAASLRQLRRMVDEMGVRMDATSRAKAGIQGRLNVDERARYQRRHPTPGVTEPAETAVPPAPEAAPAAATTPAETDAGAPAPELVTDASTPSFVADLTDLPEGADYSHTADTQPKPPPGLREASEAEPGVDSAVAPPTTPGTGAVAGPPEAQAPLTAEPGPELPPPPPVERLSPPEPASAQVPRPPGAAPVRPLEPIPRAAPRPAAAARLEPETEPDYRRPTPPRGTPVVRPSMPAEAADQPPAPEEVPASARPTPARGIPSVERQRADQAGEFRPPGTVIPPPTPQADTGNTSIWEVFGVRRPSEEADDVLQDLLRSVHAKQAEERATRRAARRAVAVRQLHVVMGLRLRLALQAVRVRLHW